jgi:hypothetical protein
MESIATTEKAGSFKPASFAGSRKSSGLKLQIIPFKARHVQLIKPDATPEMLELAQICESHNGYTACILGDPVAAAGVVMQQVGIGEIWSIFGPIVKCYPKQLFAECKRLMAEVIAREKPRRLYAIVDPNDPKSIRFMEHLGFAMTRHIYTKEVR